MIDHKLEPSEPLLSARVQLGFIELLFLLMLPILSYLLFRPSPINQAGSIDPYVYTGYIHNIEDLLARYHLPYYSVRFGLILPARLFGLVFGFDWGYLIFRYVLALIAGITLYLLTKRYFGIPLAVAMCIALLTSPFLARSLFWDHPDAAAVPYLLGSIGLFVLGLSPQWAWDTLVGFLFGLALHSNFFTVSIFGLFVASLLVSYLIHGQPWRLLFQRFVWVCVGVITATAIGVLYYFYLAGVWDIFSPTKEVVLWLSRGGMQQWRIPGVAWIGSNLAVLVLPVVAFFSALMLLLQKRTLVFSIFTIYVMAIAAYYYIYHFVLKANILQLPYYFAYCLPALFLALPVLFDSLWKNVGHSHRTWLSVISASGFVGPWLLIPFAFDWRPHVHLILFGTLAALLAALLAVCFYIRMPGKLLPAMVAITTLLIGIVIDFGFGGDTYGHLFHSKTTQTEQEVYRVAEQFMAAVPKMRDQPGGVRFWYNNRPGNFANSVQATYLWGYSRCNLVASDDPGMPFIGPFEYGLFRDKTVKYIVLLGETEDENEKGMTALQKREIGYRVLNHSLLSSGNYHIYFATLELMGR